MRELAQGHAAVTWRDSQGAGAWQRKEIISMRERSQTGWKGDLNLAGTVRLLRAVKVREDMLGRRTGLSKDREVERLCPKGYSQ